VGLAVLAVALGVAGVLALRSASSPMPIRESAPLTSGVRTTAPSGAAQSPARVDTAPTPSNPSIPARAWQTLSLIDAGQWPGSATPGTEGGDIWYDRDAALPATDASGRPIGYREWDVNPKQPGHSRDAERIVTGSDGSAWYTGNHYRTFTRMR
jgi:guanyl-specific ribonuclease Sa